MSGPSTGTQLATLARVNLLRFVRGRSLWVSVIIGLLPFVVSFLLRGMGSFEAVEVVQFLVLALLPPLFVAASLGEELEERTMTYLWSRPIPRWAVVVGKLISLAPLATLLLVTGQVLAHLWWFGKPPTGQQIVALAAGAMAISAMSAGLATLVPRHAMALSIVYLVIFDLSLGAIPASINNISITHQVSLLSEPGAPLAKATVTITAIAALWLAIGMWRIRRIEA